MKSELSKTDFEILEIALGNHEIAIRSMARALGEKTEGGINLLVGAEKVRELRNKLHRADEAWLEWSE